MKIRTARKTDKDFWLEMRNDLWPNSLEEHRLEIDEYFDNTSVDIDHAFVVEADGKLIGFTEINIRNYAEGSRLPEIPYVEAWYIKGEHRNKGYGTKLMEHIEHWCLENGYSELASDTTLSNTKSIRMHKSLGFVETERMVCFLKKLE